MQNYFPHSLPRTMGHSIFVVYFLLACAEIEKIVPVTHKWILAHMQHQTSVNTVTKALDWLCDPENQYAVRITGGWRLNTEKSFQLPLSYNLPENENLSGRDSQENKNLSGRDSQKGPALKPSHDSIYLDLKIDRVEEDGLNLNSSSIYLESQNSKSSDSGTEIMPEIVSLTFEDGTPIYQMERGNGTTITTREIVDATDVIENFGEISNGLPLDAIKPELALAWIAKAYNDRKRLTNPPAGLVYQRLNNWRYEKHPNQRYFKDPLKYLPDEYAEQLGLTKYECKSCVDENFSTLTAYENHVQTAHDAKVEQKTEIIYEIDSSVNESVIKTWQAVLAQLQAEMPRASFDTWVRDTQPISFDEQVLSIGVRNAYARDWLESRLESTVNRLLNGNITVCFVVADTSEQP